MDKARQVHNEINKGDITYGSRRIKLWNEDCQSKKERLSYWGRFDRYFRLGIDVMDIRESDFRDYCDRLGDRDDWN